MKDFIFVTRKDGCPIRVNTYKITSVAPVQNPEVSTYDAGTEILFDNGITIQIKDGPWQRVCDLIEAARKQPS